jgi:hypothetical protein
MCSVPSTGRHERRTEETVVGVIGWIAFAVFVVYPLSSPVAALLDLWLDRHGVSIRPLLIVYWPIWWLIACLGD